MKKPTILIVDDVEINREMLCEIFHECNTLQAANGKEAIDIIAANPDQISVMLLDVVMPDMDGMAVLEEMKKRKWIDHLPVLLITGESTTQIERKAYQMGVADIIRKPFDAFIVKQRTKNIIELYYNKAHLEKMVELQTKVLRKQADELQSMNERIIDTMGNIVEFRNLESGDHVKRVKTFTNILAQYVAKNYPEYKLDAHTISVITSAAALHDVGKIAISDAILLKPGRLTKDEFEIMKSHTTRGCEIIDMMADIQQGDYGRISYEICRHHHERYDGNGYPDGLKGEDIPISAQIVSVADVYDALVSERCYKSAYTTEEAYNMIIKGECGVFSPKLMNCFTLARAEFEAVAKSNRRMQEEKHA
jgi:putative two-component system response regulator